MEQRVRRGRPLAVGDQGACRAVLDRSLPVGVAVEDRGDTARASRLGQKLRPEADQPARRHRERDPHAAGVGRLHVRQHAPPRGQQLGQPAHVVFLHVDDDLLHRLLHPAVRLLHDHRRLGHLHLVAFAAHGFDQYRELQFPAAHHPKGVRGVGLLHAQAHVLAPLGQQPLAQMARRHVAPVASGPRRAVHAEDHFDSRLVDAQQRQRDRALAVGNRLADLHVLDAGHGHNVARGCGGDGLPFQAVPAEHLRHLARHARSVRAAQRVRLGAAQRAPQQPADGQPPDVIVVIQIRDLKLYRPVRGIPRPGQRGHDQLEQRLQIRAGCLQLARSDPGTRVRVHNRKLDLLFGGVEFDEQIVDFVQHLRGPRVAPVDLVEAHEGRQPGFQGFLEHETGLRQRPFRGVHQQHDAVDHRQRTFDLAAEVGVPGRIHEIDLDPAKEQRRVLGQNGDPAFAFQRERVHHPLDHRRVGAERAALPEQRIDQRCLAVIDVRDDGDVPNVAATPFCRIGRLVRE